jgi:uncharacterized membrane protein
MKKSRLEAFTDGVIAVIITIMVLELKAPAEPTWPELLKSWPVFLSYILSFIYVGIYWNNHHHMLQLVKNINGKVMWSNLFFLFSLSLLPFATAWLNEAHPHPALVPTIFYGFILFLTAVSWVPLSRSLIAANGGDDSELGEAFGSDWKGKSSIVIYAIAIVLAIYNPIISCVLYAAVAASWFVPDRRIESRLQDK